jgi:hypothetical protein
MSLKLHDAQLMRVHMSLFLNKNGGHIPFVVVVIEDLKNRSQKNVLIMTTLGEKAKEENM